MLCSSCHVDNPAENHFCEECGSTLEVRCETCGKPVRPNAKFCGACGARQTGADEAEPSRRAPLAAEDRSARLAAYTPKHLAEKILTSRSALEGERRQVTVLFADAAGFTSLAEKLDPEEVHGIVDAMFERITAEIHRFEGTINQYTGDGVMALFGAPIAHEDGPRRAVHAALGIQREIRAYSAELEANRGLRLAMRIGINTGTVVVGKIGDDLRMDYTAVGDTTNLAARLQQAARPGSVLLSETTHKLLAEFFDTVDLGEIRVKGHKAPVHAFEALASRVRRARRGVTSGQGLTPLVGRERELSTLEDVFRHVKAGRGQVAFVVGDAGIGKSRLAYEFRRQLTAAGESVTWLEGRCVSFGHAIPFLPIIDQLRENFGIEEVDGEPEIIAKIEHDARRLGGLETHIPYLRYLLSVDPGDPSISAVEPTVRRKKIFDALAALSLRGASVRPLVLFVEDLHWIDTSSEEYLASFMDSVAHVPLLLILTYRLGYDPPFGNRSFFTTLTLRSLSEAETLAMAGRVLGADRFPEELRAALMEKADGVPLFVEEVAKTLLDLGVLRREEGGYRLLKTIDEVSVPETIQGIIMARLDRLGDDGKRTVQLASVIGRQFLVRLLERIAGRGGKLDGLLRELKSLEIIYEQGLLPEPAYVFKHAFIQDVAYQSLLVQRRRKLHRLVAQAIEELYESRLHEHHEELAHHFELGQVWPKAFAYSLLAGDRAAHSSANVEAKDHYRRALAAAAKAGPAVNSDSLADLHRSLARVLGVLSEYDAALAEYEHALDLSRRSGDRVREVKALLGVTDVYNFSHRGEPAVEANEKAMAIAREIGDRGLQAVCHANRVQLQSAGWGRILEVIPDAEEALRLSKEIGDPALLAQTLVFLAQMLVWRGDFARALGYLEEAVELAQRSHQGMVFGFAAFMAGSALVGKAEYEAALGWYRRLSEYASAAGDKFMLARVPNLIAGVHLELFDLPNALRLNLEADEAAQKHWPWPEPRGHSLLKAGLAHLGLGDHASADDLFQKAWSLLDKDAWYRWRWHIPLLRARGELALAEGRHEEAWGHAEQSAALAMQSDSKKHVARALTQQGRILAARGDPDGAIGFLTRAVSGAEKIGAAGEVWSASSALAGLLLRVGRDEESEAAFLRAAEVIEAIAEKLSIIELRRSFLTAPRVAEVYDALQRRAPTP